MRLTSWFKHIESVKFAVNFTVISGFRIFQQALEADETLREFIAYLKQNPNDKYELLSRLVKLARDNPDPATEHPSDIALAAYLYVLSRVSSVLADVAATKLQSVPNLWWSRRLAKTVADSMITASAQTEVRSLVTQDSRATRIKVRSVSNVKNTGNAAIRFPVAAPGMFRMRNTITARAS